jgi:hypothetical protein
MGSINFEACWLGDPPASASLRPLDIEALATAPIPSAEQLARRRREHDPSA